MLDLSRIEAAVNAVALEKHLPKDRLFAIIERAIETAFKKDYATKETEVSVHLDIVNQDFEILVAKRVVEVVEDPDTEIALEEVAESGYELGDLVEIDMSDEVIQSGGFGRIAAQAAKQIIVQKIQETEKEKIYELFQGKEDTIISLKIDLVEKNRVVLDYQGNQITLPKSEQVSKDKYIAGHRMQFYVREVSNDPTTGPQVILSRKDKELVVKLFEASTPELEDETVEIVSIARMPGVKTKIIVASDVEGVDPAGCLIGPKGTRVRTIVDELSGEKIDILNYTTDKEEMVRRALIPGIVEQVKIDESSTTIIATVKHDEKAKVLGRGGTNINIASELLGYKISLISAEEN